MSRLRNRFAADEVNEQAAQPINEESVQPVIEEQNPEPVQEQVQEAPVVEDQVQEEVQPVQEESTEQQDIPVEETKEDGEGRGALADFGEEYTNQWGKVTPYHILFKDYGDQISKLAKDQAAELCVNVIDDLAEKYSGDPDYTNPSPDALSKFKESIGKDTRSGMDVLFKVKDFLLASEGMAVAATIEDALRNPKIARRVASVFNTLIKAHDDTKNK